MADLTPITVTITAAGTVSTPANLGFKTLVGISLPANWTTSAITFQASPDGAIYQPVFDAAAGTATAIVVGAGVASNFIVLDNPDQWAAINQLRLVSATTQTNTVVVTLFVRTVAF